MALGVGPFSTGPIAIEMNTEMQASNQSAPRSIRISGALY